MGPTERRGLCTLHYSLDLEQKIAAAKATTGEDPGMTAARQGLASGELFKPVPRQDSNCGERGYAELIALMIACVVMLILAAAAVPSFSGLRRMQNQLSARRQLTLVSSAFSTKSLCSVALNNCSSAGTDPLIPATGTTTTSGYNYAMTLSQGTSTTGLVTCDVRIPTQQCFGPPYCYQGSICPQNSQMTFSFYDVTGMPTWWILSWQMTPPPTFTYVATPVTPGISGTFSYRVTETGVLRCIENGTITATSPVCQ